MGANTYIGNAPNFMVKAIAEQSGIRMPSFFRVYALVGGNFSASLCDCDVSVPIMVISYRLSVFSEESLL